MVSLPDGLSRLVFPQVRVAGLAGAAYDSSLVEQAMARDAVLGYLVPSGRYWDEGHRFDAGALAGIDAVWLAAAHPAPHQCA